MARNAFVAGDFDVERLPVGEVLANKGVGLRAVKAEVIGAGERVRAFDLIEIGAADKRSIVVAAASANSCGSSGGDPGPGGHAGGGRLDLAGQGAEGLVEAGRAVLPVVLDDGDIAIFARRKSFLTAMRDDVGVWATCEHGEMTSRVTNPIQSVRLVASGSVRVGDGDFGAGVAIEIGDRGLDGRGALLRVVLQGVGDGLSPDRDKAEQSEGDLDGDGVACGSPAADSVLGRHFDCSELVAATYTDLRCAPDPATMIGSTVGLPAVVGSADTSKQAHNLMTES